MPNVYLQTAGGHFGERILRANPVSAIFSPGNSFVSYNFELCASLLGV